MTELEQLLLKQFEQQQSESEQRQKQLSAQLIELQQHVEDTLNRYEQERQRMSIEVQTIRDDTRAAMKSMSVQIGQIRSDLKQSDGQSAATFQKLSISVGNLSDSVKYWTKQLGS